LSEGETSNIHAAGTQNSETRLMCPPSQELHSSHFPTILISWYSTVWSIFDFYKYVNTWIVICEFRVNYSVTIMYSTPYIRQKFEQKIYLRVIRSISSAVIDIFQFVFFVIFGSTRCSKVLKEDWLILYKDWLFPSPIFDSSAIMHALCDKFTAWTWCTQYLLLFRRRDHHQKTKTISSFYDIVETESMLLLVCVEHYTNIFHYHHEYKHGDIETQKSLKLDRAGGECGEDRCNVFVASSIPIGVSWKNTRKWFNFRKFVISYMKFHSLWVTNTDFQFPKS
jgi:hypothetical protein